MTLFAEKNRISKRITEKKQQIESLQSLRTVAFLLIFISHCIPVRIMGELGVSVFFILSGFVMCYAYQERKPNGTLKECIVFGIKKIRKLYPLHLITMLASIPLIIESLSTRQLWISVLANLTLLQSWIPHGAYYFSCNAVAWYLSTSLFLYCIFPVLIRMIPDKKQNSYYIYQTGLAYLLMILLGIFGNLFRPNLISISDNFSKWLNYICPISRVLNLYIGILLGYLFLLNAERIKEIPAKKANLWMIAAVGLVVGAVVLINSSIPLFQTDGITSNALVTPGAIALLVVFAVNRDFLSNLLTNKYLLYIAKYTPQMFLIHRLLILYFDVFCRKMGMHVPVLLQAGICFVLSLFFSVLFCNVERRVNKLISRL